VKRADISPPGILTRAQVAHMSSTASLSVWTGGSHRGILSERCRSPMDRAAAWASSNDGTRAILPFRYATRRWGDSTCDSGRGYPL